jgi:hypothetical protein
VGCWGSVAVAAPARNCAGRPGSSLCSAAAVCCTICPNRCGARMSKYTSQKLLTSCAAQGYRLRGQDVVAALAASGGRTARNGHAVAASGSSGREDHAQDHQGSPQIDHHPASDARAVVRGSVHCQHRHAVWNVDRQSLSRLPLPRSAHCLRNLVRNRLPACSQTHPAARDNHCPHPDSTSPQVHHPLKGNRMFIYYWICSICSRQRGDNTLTCPCSWE